MAFLKKQNPFNKSGALNRDASDLPRKWAARNVTKLEDFYNKYISSPETDKKIKTDLFNYIRPDFYPTFSKVLKAGYKGYGRRLLGKEAAPQRDIDYDKEGDLGIHEEAWAKALGKKHDSKYIIPSEYSPGDSKDTSAKYFKLREGIIDWNKILDAMPAYDKGEDNSKKGKPVNMDALVRYINKDNVNPDEYADIDPIQGFQLQWGYDKEKKQRYVSFYDKYDFRGVKSDKLVKPYEFYERYYIPKDQEKNTDTKDQEKNIDTKEPKYTKKFNPNIILGRKI